MALLRRPCQAPAGAPALCAEVDAAENVRGRAGLDRKSSAPEPNACARASSEPSTVFMMMKGGSAHSARTRVINSMPFISGIIQSVMSTSTAFAFRYAMASKPLETSLSPGKCGRSTPSSRARKKASSSAISTFGGESVLMGLQPRASAAARRSRSPPRAGSRRAQRPRASRRLH